jgi:hypothetical protein
MEPLGASDMDGWAAGRVSGSERVKRPAIPSYGAKQLFSTGVRLLSCWLAGLGKLLQSIKLIAKHTFNSRRNLLESTFDESTDTI